VNKPIYGVCKPICGACFGEKNQENQEVVFKKKRKKKKKKRKKKLSYWNGWQLKVQSIHINALQKVKIFLTTQGIPETVVQTLLLNFTDMY